MSVLICPVCQGSMRELAKDGVTIDTCTKCRGVWLDRGELEKLSSIVGAGQERSFISGTPMHNQSSDRRRRDDDDDDEGEYRKSYGSQSKRRSFLDFFD